MHHADHRNARRRQPRQPVETAAAVDEGLHPIRQQVGTGRFDQVDERQLLLQRNGLRALELLDAHRLHGAGVDARVVHDDHRAHAADPADAGDEAAAGNRARRVRVVQAETGQRGQLQERRAGIEQTPQAVARQQLATLLEARARSLGLVACARFQRAQLVDEFRQCGVVLAVRVAVRDDARIKRRHRWPPRVAGPWASRPGESR